MALQTPRIRTWPFSKTPARLKELFLDAKTTDWVAIVPQSLIALAESHFIRMRQLHPVTSVRLPDGNFVYWGAPRKSISLIAENSIPAGIPTTRANERRGDTRVQLAGELWYETLSLVHKRTGIGRIIDVSSSGASFTTESLLRKRTRVLLHISWPVPLEGGVPVELFAGGKVVRADQHTAALKYDQISFRVANPIPSPRRS